MMIATTARPRTWRRSAATVAAGAGALGLGLSALAPPPVGATRRAPRRRTRAFFQATHEPGYGSVLSDAHGQVLYALSDEGDGTLSCKSTTCLHLWPPVLVGAKTKASAIALGKGVTGSVGFVKRGAGRKQVTFDGYPVYRFAGDRTAGQDSGEGVHADGGVWELVTASSLLAPRSSAKSG